MVTFISTNWLPPAGYVKLKAQHVISAELSSSSCWLLPFVPQFKHHIQTEIPLLQTEWKFQQTAASSRPSDSLEARAECLPPLAFSCSEPEPLGVSDCDLISTENYSPEASTHWCSLRVCVCFHHQQARMFTELARFTTRRWWMLVPVTRPIHCSSFWVFLHS